MFKLDDLHVYICIYSNSVYVYVLYMCIMYYTYINLILEKKIVLKIV